MSFGMGEKKEFILPGMSASNKLTVLKPHNTNLLQA